MMTFCLLLAAPALALADDAGLPVVCSNIYNTIPLLNPLHIKIKNETEEYAIQLSHLPNVKLTGVLDNAITGRRIPLIWDPLDAPRLSYAVNLTQGEWTLTFRSEYLYKTSETTSSSAARHSIAYQPVIEVKDALAAKDVLEDRSIVYRYKEEYEHVITTCRDYLNQHTIDAYSSFHPCIKKEIYKEFIEQKKRFIQAICSDEKLCEYHIKELQRFEIDKNIIDTQCSLTPSSGSESRQFKIQPSDLFSYVGNNNVPLWNSRNSDIVVTVGPITKEQRQAAGQPTDSGRSDSSAKPLSTAVDAMGASEWRAATGRSFSDATPQVLVDMFSILAEIAFERAKAKSFSLLSDKARDVVCAKLTGTALRKAAADADAEALKWLPQGDAPLLPQTCEVIQGLRIQELAASGKSLYTAFLRDLVALSLMSVTQHKSLDANSLEVNLLEPLLQPLLSAVQMHVLNVGTLTERDVQVMFLTLAKDYVKITDSMRGDGALQPALCPVRLALAVVAECQARGGCDAPAISEYLQKPEKYLSDSQCQEQWNRFLPNTSLLISRGLEIVRPSKALAPQLLLRNLTSFMLDVIALLAKHSPNLRFPFDQESLTALGNIISGVLEQEIQMVLTGGGRFVTHGLASATSKPIDGSATTYLRKFTAVTGAIASYAQSYAANGEALDDKQAKAQREARKRAIESMMELTTSRSARAGDFIASLGIMPGVSVFGGQAGPGVKDDGVNKLQYAQLALPTGIALQWLPKASSCLGWHLQVSFVDLAQFVSFDGSARPSMNSLTWADFVLVGLQGGILLGNSPNALFFLGADLRYAPTLSFQDPPGKQGVFRGSFNVGYYVPFFDFN